MSTMEKTSAFDVTRCSDCGSDEIYAFQNDDGGGMCTKCKLMISGIIRGGLSQFELRRRRGEITVKEVDDKAIIEKERAQARNIETIRQNVEIVKKQLELSKSSTTLRPVISTVPVLSEKPAVQKPKGPGFIEKTVGMFRKFQDELKKTEPKEDSYVDLPKKKETMVTVTPISPAPVPAPASNGKPQIGERWTLSKCIVCKRTASIAGEVKSTVEHNSRLGYPKGYVWIWSDVVGAQKGCPLCAKKA